MPDTKIDIAELRGRIARHDYPDWADIAPLLDQLEQSQREKDEALDRIEELVRDAEIVSAEFEKDCWQAVRALLEKVGWTDFSEGVSANLACEIVWDAIASSNKRAEASQARVAELTAEVEARTLDAALLKAEYVALRHDKDAAQALVARLRGALDLSNHATNEWADAFYGASQWIKNIDAEVSSPTEALVNLEASADHCQAVWKDASDARQALQEGE